MTEDRFGPFLRVARNACEMTQRALAGEVGLDHTYISKIERGKAPPPSISTLQRMAAVLRVPPTLMCNVAGRINQDMTKPKLEGYVLELRTQLASLTTERDALLDERDRLREAPDWYASPEYYWEADNGKRATEALEQPGSEEEG